jgi:AAA domain
LSWRDEIDIVLQEWVNALGGGQGGPRWQRVGAVRRTGEPGVYIADVRATGLTADQADDLRLAGPEDRNDQAGFPVMEVTFEGELARLRVAEFADLADPYLWRLRQEPTFLVTALREGFNELKEAGLANLLARSEIGGELGAVDPPPGWKDAQQDAYRACLGTGLWLVWGPPGTGKTRVLRAAVSDLLSAGKRVLLVSGTNIAVDDALARCQLRARDGLQAAGAAREGLKAARAAAAQADPFRPQWAGIENTEAELAQVENAAQQSERRALVAKKACGDAEDAIADLCQPDGKVRWRDRRALREAQERLDRAQEKYEPLLADAAEARRIADAFRRDTETAIARLSASAPFSRDEIRRRDAAVKQASARVRASEEAQFSTVNHLTELRAAQAAARAAEELIAACTRRKWPGRHAQATALRSDIARDEARRHTVEERHAELQQQYERLAKAAEGEIIKEARLVATTLARFRLVRAVRDGPYDVVLIDEVGAATLPEVLLAVAKAGQCAVLLGDFMQLGPILPRALEDSDRQEIRRWLVTDPFRHCGISTLAEAVRHPSCLVLDTQHRFGPHIMRLANLLAYDGLLKAGENIRAHDESDPEIVLVDTDGLQDLARVRRVSRNSGWWAAGLLLSRALIELHREDGETTGVVTPYAVQAEVTLEALRDLEPDGRPLAEVGTAHRFQGREFPVVVFDTVEPWHDGNLWIGQASSAGHRNGCWPGRSPATRKVCCPCRPSPRCGA